MGDWEWRTSNGTGRSRKCGAVFHVSKYHSPVIYRVRLKKPLPYKNPTICRIIHYFLVNFSEIIRAIPHGRHGTGSGSPYATLHYAVWCVGARGARGVCGPRAVRCFVMVAVRAPRAIRAVRAVRAVRCFVTPKNFCCKIESVEFKHNGTSLSVRSHVSQTEIHQIFCVCSL